MNKFVAYYRVSTQKQGVSGLGLESQRTATRDYVKHVRGKLVSAFQDIESGSKDNRPELLKALRECRLTGATLLIAKLDRLSRNRRFLIELQESSTKFICCDMPEANDLTVGILACMAEHERKMISVRTIAALAAVKKRGVKLGNPNIHLVRNTDTSAATNARVAKAKIRNRELKQILLEIKESSSERLSLRGLARYLNEAGYKTTRGQQFHATTVGRILDSPSLI